MSVDILDCPTLEGIHIDLCYGRGSRVFKGKLAFPDETCEYEEIGEWQAISLPTWNQDLMIMLADEISHEALMAAESWNRFDAEKEQLLHDILLVDRIILKPQHRGQGLGPKAMKSIITGVGHGHEIAIICPFPLCDGEEDRSASEIEEGRLKLARYWTTQCPGFEPLDVDKTHYWLNLTLKNDWLGLE